MNAYFPTPPITSSTLPQSGLIRSRSSIDESALGVPITPPAAEQYLPAPEISEIMQRARAHPQTHDTVLRLADYRQHAAEYLAHGYQADFAVSGQDIAHLPLLIESENARKPGMGLVYCRDDNTLHDILTDLQSDAARGVTRHARLIHRALVGGHHHFYVDVLALPGKPLSLIEMEPVDQRLVVRSDLTDKLTRWEIEHRTHMVLPRVQKSDNDCIIFSLSLASKAFAHKEHLFGMHMDQLAGYFNEVAAGRELPAAFYKHLQSSSQLKQRVRRRRELITLAVNKRGQTLHKRFVANLAKNQAGQIYNISIELKRLALIDRAIRHFAPEVPLQAPLQSAPPRERSLLRYLCGLG